MVSLGVERLLSRSRSVVGDDRVGLLTNHAAVDHALRPTVDRLHAHDDIDLRRLYGPEHGIRGTEQAGVAVKSSVDSRTGLPVESLYGETRRLTPALLNGVDTLVCDLQDVGSRYYTLISTLAYAMEGVAAADGRMVVLDRPNPIAPLGVSGNRVEPVFSSFVGDYRLPITHGLTIGELARYINDEFDIGATVDVVEVRGWQRSQWFDETDLPWVLPSPNVPTLTTATLYPGTCLLEGTNLSEGRGTTKPFELVGAPWLDAGEWATQLEGAGLDGVAFRPTAFQPMFSKHQEETVEGVQAHICDRNRIDPVRVGLTLLVSAFTASEKTAWVEDGDEYVIDRLAGSDTLRRTVDRRRGTADPNAVVDEILADWESDRVAFQTVREEYERY
ncbi:exo-beta-N-acetylmuramidase NamZ family protein [Halolamina rubra]|uniref:exo-beta-N-acetylmuramidase NamZ family protein n=1 Tax=Halolamina rubra TaxID=1380430 RepID=UPI0006786BF9|nr:DUF1343 domain-containing protein [Halolamina rubra]